MITGSMKTEAIAMRGAEEETFVHHASKKRLQSKALCDARKSGMSMICHKD